MEPEARRRASETHRALWLDPRYRQNQLAAMATFWGSPRASAARALLSHLMAARWQGPLRGRLLAAAKATASLRRRQPVVHVPLREFTREEKKELGRRRFRVIQAGRRAKGTVADLRRLVAESRVPVKRYPVGAHSGWHPSWMGD